MEIIKYLETDKKIEDAILEPAHLLNKSALKLWIYFYTKCPHSFEPKEAYEQSGIGRSTFYTSMNELMAKKYLIQQEKGQFIFKGNLKKD